MSEYHPEWDNKNIVPVPKCLPTKDHKMEENALGEIMTLAIYGATLKISSEGGGVFEETQRVFELFRKANLIL